MTSFLSVVSPAKIGLMKKQLKPKDNIEETAGHSKPGHKYNQPRQSDNCKSF